MLLMLYSICRAGHHRGCAFSSLFAATTAAAALTTTTLVEWGSRVLGHKWGQNVATHQCRFLATQSKGTKFCHRAHESGTYNGKFSLK